MVPPIFSLVVSVTSKFPFRSFVTTIEPPVIDPRDASSALSASKARSGSEKVTIAAAFMIGFQTLSYRDVMPNSWGWLLASGIADLVLAGLIIYAWPASASWTLGLIVGINLITTGLAIVMTAMEVRNLAKSLSQSDA
jgi:hypothetical protein